MAAARAIAAGAARRARGALAPGDPRAAAARSEPSRPTEARARRRSAAARATVTAREQHGAYVVLRCAGPRRPAARRPASSTCSAAAERWGGGEGERPVPAARLQRARGAPDADRRAALPDRGRRPGHQAAVRARAGRRAAAGRPARRRLRAPRARAASRCWSAAAWGSRRWPSGRTSSAPRTRVLLGLPRRRATPPARRCCTAPERRHRRRQRRPPRARHRAARRRARRAATTSRSTPADRRRCSRRSARSAPSAASRRSSRSSPGWPAGSGRASAAWSPTRDGYIRLCLEGPVLDAALLRSTWPGARRSRRSRRSGALIEFCGIELEHPIINGSGTFDAIAARRAFGDELIERFPFAAFVSKTVTLEPRAGQPAAAAVGARRRDDQLDRPAQQGPATATSSTTCPSSRGCRCR